MVNTADCKSAPSWFGWFDSTSLHQLDSLLIAWKLSRLSVEPVNQRTFRGHTQLVDGTELIACRCIGSSPIAPTIRGVGDNGIIISTLLNIRTQRRVR